jgi:hypothetical protein
VKVRSRAEKNELGLRYAGWAAVVVSTVGLMLAEATPAIELNNFAGALWFCYLLMVSFGVIAVTFTEFASHTNRVVSAWFVSLASSFLFAALLASSRGPSVYALAMMASAPPTFFTTWAGLYWMARSEAPNHSAV